VTASSQDTSPVIDRAAIEDPETPLGADDLARAAGLLTRLGFVQIDRVLRPDVANTLHEAFVSRYANTIASGRPDTIPIADGRYMTAVAIADEFNDPRLYANACVLAVVRAVLGRTARLASFGSVTAMPFAQAQPLHRDHPPLFPESALSSLLPCHALTVIFPLVDVAAASGSTAVWLGTHRDAADVDDLREDAAFVPSAAPGSVYMMDYRLAHRGLANPLDRVRPIMTLVYARPWFSDSVSFDRVPMLRLPADVRAAMPEAYQSLFVHREWS
jgi:hypothetical protein